MWQLANAILYRGIKQAGINQDLEPLRWTVENTIPSLTAVRLDRSQVTGGDSLSGSFEIDHLGPGQAVDVRLTSDIGDVTLLPDSMRAIGGPASYTFRIATRYVSFDRTARISARIGPANADNAASATLRVNSLSVGLEGLNRDLFAGEVRALLLRLSQPAPGPITVTLDSADPSRLAIPQRVTFRKGEQVKSIQVKAGVSVRTLATVNIRARVGSSDVLIPTRVGPVRR